MNRIDIQVFDPFPAHTGGPDSSTALARFDLTIEPVSISLSSIGLYKSKNDRYLVTLPEYVEIKSESLFQTVKAVLVAHYEAYERTQEGFLIRKRKKPVSLF